MSYLQSLDHERDILCSRLFGGVLPAEIRWDMFEDVTHRSVARAISDGQYAANESTARKYGYELAGEYAAIEGHICRDDSESVRFICEAHARRARMSEEMRSHAERIRRLEHDSDVRDILETPENDSDVIYSEDFARKGAELLRQHNPIRTGMPVVDSMLDSLGKGEVLTIAGRSHTGKTAFAIQLCEWLHQGGGGDTLFLSLEMAHKGLAKRMHDINLYRADDMATFDACKAAIRQVKHDDDYAQKMLTPKGIHFVTKSMSIQQLESLVLREKKKRKINAVAIDYLQYLPGKGEVRERVSANAMYLKGMAKRLDVLVIALSQINRKGEDGFVEPQLNWLAESGDIENGSDSVLFLWLNKADQTKINLRMAKSRLGDDMSPKTMRKHGVAFLDATEKKEDERTSWNEFL